MVTDLVQIRRLGETKRAENGRFRQYLKRHAFAEKRLLRIGAAVEEATNCTTCANCCRVATVRLNDRDVDRLARHLGMRVGDLLAAHTQESDEGLILKRTDAGCTFLEGSLCGVYEARPHNCANFPHVQKGEGSLLSRMWEFGDRATYCPIVYNTLEEWKAEVGFRTVA